jgi:hypothetical protein
MTGHRRGGKDKPPGRHLRVADAPEYTEEERKIGLARLVFLQAYQALFKVDPDAGEWLTELFTVEEP